LKHSRLLSGTSVLARRTVELSLAMSEDERLTSGISEEPAAAAAAAAASEPLSDDE